MKTGEKMKKNTIENAAALAMITLTVIVSAHCHLTQENWTALLLTEDKWLLYVLGTLGSLLFCFLLYRFSCAAKHPQKTGCILTSLYMPISLFFVYEPQNQPFATMLHLVFSYLFFFCVNFQFLSALVHLHYRELFKAKRIAQAYFLVLGTCIASFLIFMSINTLFELLFTCGMTLLLCASIHYIGSPNPVTPEASLPTQDEDNSF